jgi:sugar transferase (PEP-CTERM system associated)
MWRHLFRYLAVHKIAAVAAETVIAIVCLMGDAVPGNMASSSWRYFVSWFGSAFFVAIAFQIFLHLRDVYDFQGKASSPDFLIRLGQALVMASVFLIVANHFLALVVVRLPTLIRVSLALSVWHILLRLYFGFRAERTNVLIIGTGHLARELAKEILRHRHLGFTISGFLDDNPELQGVSIVNPKVIGFNRDLSRVVNEKKVQKVIVELQDRRGRLPFDELLSLKTHGMDIEEATSIYERLTGKIAIENLKPSWMIFNEGFEVSPGLLLQKQITSFLVSAVLFVIFLPLFPILALLIKLDSKGPVFHQQERVGQDGKTFTLWKFRSMYQDAERHTGPVWSAVKDKRVTRVGKYLRRTRLDELPQLYNILRGDMSLIGPRPERPHFVKQLSEAIPFYNLRHVVKPGVTGWAQIKYRYGNTVEDAIEKLQYDLFYIKNLSWLLDLIVIFDTAKTVLVRRGS